MGGMIMEIAMLILTVIGTIATIISTYIAVRAKNEAKEVLKEINSHNNRNVSNSGKIEIKSDGCNTGIISGINTGEVNSNVKK